MNIENLARQALDRIKTTWGLPKSGFLAGGSIANIIWEMVSGNKAVVNDIDIFHFVGIKETYERKDKESLFNFRNTQTTYYEDYTGMCFTTKTKEFYSIVSAEKEDIFNNINYKSNVEDPSLIIRSFDINSTRVGYSIDEDKIYWTPEFEDFLKTGELKVCNLMTPCHTAVRIAKKADELNAKLKPFEFKLLQYALSRSFSDKIKWRFKDRYQKMYEKYVDLLEPYFLLDRDKPVEEFVFAEYGEKVELYFLTANIPGLNGRTNKKDVFYFDADYDKVFTHPNLISIYRTTDFIFYMRNIWGNKQLEDLWPKLDYFFVTENYVDGEFSQDDIDLLSRFSRYAPNSIENLKGLKLSEQLHIIKRFLDNYKEDPLVAISILESVKVDKDILLDEETSLLLELSVRKKIINDTRGKVKMILEGVGGKDQNHPNIDLGI